MSSHESNARYSKALTEVFAAYGAEAEAGLQAYANIDPQGWSAFVDSAAEKQYLVDYRNWSRSLVRSADKERLTEQSGQARLFDLAESTAMVKFRERIVLDGTEYDVATLHDSRVVRKVAERDLAPALTTVQRCKAYFALADHMDAEAERLGRPVTAGEVLGWAA